MEESFEERVKENKDCINNQEEHFIDSIEKQEEIENYNTNHHMELKESDMNMNNLEFESETEEEEEFNDLINDELSKIIIEREKEMKEANEEGTPFGKQIKELLDPSTATTTLINEDQSYSRLTTYAPPYNSNFEELFYDNNEEFRFVNEEEGGAEEEDEDSSEDFRFESEEEEDTDDVRLNHLSSYPYQERYGLYNHSDEEDDGELEEDHDDEEDYSSMDEMENEDNIEDGDIDEDEDEIMTPRRHAHIRSNNRAASNEDEPEQMERLHVKVVHPTQLYEHFSRDMGELTFLIRWNTPLRKLLVAYCTKLKLPLDIITFSFDGELLSYDSDDTALMLDMEDYDVIETEIQLSGGSIESMFINRIKLEDPIYVQILEARWTQCTPMVRISDGEASVEAQFSEYAFDAAMSMTTFLAQRFAILKITKARIENEQLIHIEACSIVTEPMQPIIGFPKALDFLQIKQLILLRQAIFQEFQKNPKSKNPLYHILLTNQQYAELLYLIEKHEKSMHVKATLLERQQSSLEAAQEDACNWPLDFISNASKGGLIENLLSVLKCSVCCGLLHEPMSITPCGHSYCRTCITEVMKHNPVCPLCRSDIVDVSRNILGEKILQEFEVKCRNKHCDKIFRIENMEDHFAVCAHQVLVCQYCHQGVVRGEMKNHMKHLCTSIPCKYQVLGCEFMDTETKVTRHEHACIFSTLCEKSVLEKLLSAQSKTLSLPAEKVANLISDICSFVINHSPKLHKNLALLLHNKLKRVIENDDQLEEFFDGVMLILEHMSLKDRDMFIDQCLYYLAKRALYTYHTTLPNLESEISFLHLFKEKHGSDIVESLSCMYKDIEDNNLLDQYWQRYMREIEHRRQPVSTHVRVLTSGYWLGIAENQSYSYRIPKSIRVSEQVFSKFYKRVHSFQKLVWQHHLSTALIKSTPPSDDCHHRRYFFHVTGLQMSILLCFNRHSSLTLNDIIGQIRYQKEDEAIPLFYFKRSIVPLCSGSDETRILNCSIDIRDIITASKQTKFSLNSKFNAFKRIIKIRSGNRRDVHHHNTSRSVPSRSTSSNNLLVSHSILHCTSIKSFVKENKSKPHEEIQNDSLPKTPRKSSIASSSTPPPPPPPTL